MDLQKVNTEITKIEQRVTSHTEKHNQFLKEFGL